MSRLIVLHYRWIEDGKPRQEIYGPWAVAEDESHLGQMRSFLQAWPAASGCEPFEVTAVLVTDPAQWISERETQQD